MKNSKFLNIYEMNLLKFGLYYYMYLYHMGYYIYSICDKTA